MTDTKEKTKFYNPYHFVPFGSESAVTTPYSDILEGHERFARHDKWDKDALSGVINCQLTLLTPTITGNQHSDSKGDKIETKVNQYESPVTNDKAIASNSLKGMIASLSEALSNSAPRVLNDDIYSVRPEARGALTGMGIVDCDKDNNWFIRPLCLPESLKKKHCGGNYQRYSLQRIRRGDKVMGKQITQHDSFHAIHNPSFVYHDISASSQTFLSEDEYQAAKNEPSSASHTYVRGGLYVLDMHSDKAKMQTKISEFFVPYTEEHDAPENRLAVDPNVVDTLNNVIQSRFESQTAKERENKMYPYFPTGYNEMTSSSFRTLQAGDLIYFDVDQQQQVNRLSYSQIWRLSANKTAFDGFKQNNSELLPWGHQSRSGLTPAEKLFGVVQSDKAEDDRSSQNLAGRVRFSDATLAQEESMVGMLELITLPKLAAPKPPSPAFYFNESPQKKSDYAQQSQAKPTGRLKYYLPHRSNRPNLTADSKPQWETQLHKGSDEYKKNRDLHIQATPMAAGQTFEFNVTFENLSNAELGLLICALKPSQQFIHRIGLGKPLGLGQVEVDIDCIQFIDRSERYKSFARSSERYSKTWQVGQSVAHKLPLLIKQDGLVDEQVLAGLQWLGDPQNQQDDTPVCYPFSASKRQTPYSEKELFQWFTENYNSKNQYQPLNPIAGIKAVKPGYTCWLAADTLEDNIDSDTIPPLVAQHQPKSKRR